LLLIRFDLAAFNHVLGRDKGDDVLREAIRLIRSNLDPHDKVFRYAGAEFVVCLPGRDKHAVDELRIRLLDIVADVLATISEDPSVAPGVQSAVVELEPDVSVEHLLHQANLVASKARG
jgi:diguanylate cyclase (GGDEF)-like protein